ncbi:MAG: hypothetical protein ACI89R_001245, partial [Candidatus Azotimanducaceae bacterium]
QLINTMSNSKQTILKGVKYIAISTIFFFIGPVILSIGFRAKEDGIYIWLVIGIILSLGAIVVSLLGLRTIVKGIFLDK